MGRRLRSRCEVPWLLPGHITVWQGLCSLSAAVAPTASLLLLLQLLQVLGPVLSLASPGVDWQGYPDCLTPPS